MTPVRNVAQFTAGAVSRVPIFISKPMRCSSNKTPSGTYRGPGRFEGCFFMERLLDMAARDLGHRPARDPAAQPDLARRDALSAGPRRAERRLRRHGLRQRRLSRARSTAAWRRRAGTRRLTLQGKLIDGRYHGLGIACFIEGGGSGPRENARMELEADGTISVYVGSSAVGQGIETIMAQIAADALELPLDRIKRPAWLDDLSRRWLRLLWLALDGHGRLRDRASPPMPCSKQFRAAAAKRLGVRADDVTHRRRRRRRAGRPQGRACRSRRRRLVADGVFSNSKATYTYGTAIAHVAVDPATGQVEVLDYVVVDDVGRIINPLTLHGQVMGAAVQGLGSVFTRRSRLRRRRPASGRLARRLPGAARDRLSASARRSRSRSSPSPNNPLGAKGAGEGGIIPVGGALANAVAAALSARRRAARAAARRRGCGS